MSMSDARTVQPVPSHKLLRLAYQLASRLAPSAATDSSQAPDFQHVLAKLLGRMAMKHPHHVLLPLFALRAGGASAAAAGKAKAATDIITVRS